jgi:hypothetical protein
VGEILGFMRDEQLDRKRKQLIGKSFVFHKSKNFTFQNLTKKRLTLLLSSHGKSAKHKTRARTHFTFRSCPLIHDSYPEGASAEPSHMLTCSEGLHFRSRV